MSQFASSVSWVCPAEDSSSTNNTKINTGVVDLRRVSCHDEGLGAIEWTYIAEASHTDTVPSCKTLSVEAGNELTDNFLYFLSRERSRRVGGIDIQLMHAVKTVDRSDDD